MEHKLEVYGISDLALTLRVKESIVRKAIATGDLKSHRINATDDHGGTRAILPVDVDVYLLTNDEPEIIHSVAPLILSGPTNPPKRIFVVGEHSYDSDLIKEMEIPIARKKLKLGFFADSVAHFILRSPEIPNAEHKVWLPDVPEVRAVWDYLPPWKKKIQKKANSKKDVA